MIFLLRRISLGYWKHYQSDLASFMSPLKLQNNWNVLNWLHNYNERSMKIILEADKYPLWYKIFRRFSEAYDDFHRRKFHRRNI